MPKPARQDDDASLRALRALAKLLARQAAQQDFAKRARPRRDDDASDSGETRSNVHE